MRKGHRTQAQRRVAQTPPDNSGSNAAPAAGEGSGSGSAAPAEGSGAGSGDQAPPAAPAAPAPAPEAPATPAPAPAPAPATNAAPATPANNGETMSDAELEKLAEQQAKAEVIQVTGSLIDRKQVDTPSPITVVNKQQLEAAGVTNVGQALQQLPAQGNAINAQNNNGGDGSVRIDLRSLGSSRTLILINGRRVVPSGLGADASVDLGTIPLAMIERIEVLKDGASAIYGSDAIAGVVNVITRTDFTGTEADAYVGTSQHGDGTNYDLSFVTGTGNDRSNITLSAGYQQQYAVMAGDRDFSKQTYAYDFQNQMAILTGSSAGPTGRINTDVDGDGAPDFNVPGCTTQYCTADGKGGFRNYMPATATSFGDNFNFQPDNYLFTPSKRINLYSNGHYDLTKNVRAFFEGSYNDRKSAQQLAAEPIFTGLYGTPISADSIYNPFGAEVDDYNRRLNEFGPRTYNQDVATSRLVVGLDGKVPETSSFLKNWKWEVSYDYGRTDATDRTHGDLILSHLQNALGPSMIDPGSGQPICVGTPGDPTTAIPGCVPLNILNPNHVTSDMINYLTFTGVNYGYNEQRTTLAQAHGKLFDLPNHGDVSLALGGDYRFESGGYQPDPLTSTGDTTGNAIQPTLGSYHTWEGFGEISIVPISGTKAVKWLEIDAAGRAYDYGIGPNSYSGTTGKVAGLLRTVGGIAVRGTYGTAFRAPNIGELFSGQADSFPLLMDPCDTTNGPLDAATAKECMKQGVPANFTPNDVQERTKVGGSPKLTPETATVTTAGLVYTPIEAVGLTLDYWHIKLDNAISAIPAAVILNNCYEHGSDPAGQAFCGQVQRDPTTHRITYITDVAQNIGGIDTSGLDLGASYAKKAGSNTIRASLNATYLIKYNLDLGLIGANGKAQQQYGKGVYDYGVLPDWKFNLGALWTHSSGFGAGLNVRFVNSFKECDQDDCNDDPTDSRTVSAYAAGDIYLNYSKKTSAGQTNIQIGVDNVTDSQPPIIYNGAALNADESAYDFMGRYFYLRLTQLL